MNFQRVEFITSATSAEGFRRHDLPQIAFAGRSNVGKSSVINCVLRRKNFARVGAQPGKTVHINFFNVDDAVYFVDLPGYGYAKVSKAEKDRWGKLIEQYFAAGCIDLGVQIVDARHKPTANDLIMTQWFQQTGCPFLVVANKLDKLKKSEIEPNLQLIRQTLDLSDDTKIIPFSAEKGTGRELLVAELEAVAAAADTSQA
jgi:GTP-binding protein